MDLCTSVVNEELSFRRREEGNISDPYTVAFIKSGVIIGHVPRRISAACNLFIQRGGAVMCKVTGPRRLIFQQLISGWFIEVPCRLVIHGTRTVFSCVLPYCSPFYRVYQSIVLPATCREHSSCCYGLINKPIGHFKFPTRQRSDPSRK